MILFSDNFLLSATQIDSIRDRYKQEKYKIPMGKTGFCWSSYFQQDEFLNNIYNDKILQFLKNIPVSTSRGYLSNPNLVYWVQIYDEQAGGGHPVHDHWTPDCMISFVHFVKVPKQNCFYFQAQERIYPKQDQGDIIFFPSWASHGVDPVIECKDRIVLAGNVFVKSFISKESSNQFIRWKLIKTRENYEWKKYILTKR